MAHRKMKRKLGQRNNNGGVIIMKKYIVPQLKISCFDLETVSTGAEASMAALNTWEETILSRDPIAAIQKRKVMFDDVIKFTF